jgi:nucleoside-diphosphate-sugar epimerase
MKVLLYGKGWIGSQVINILKESNHELVLGKARVDNKVDVEAEFLEVKPTHVMSFIGRTHGVIDGKVYTTIDYLEQKGKVRENVRDNLFGPMVLGMLCVKHDIHLTYLGTGCIFEFDEEHQYGKEDNGFTEQDRPNFFGSGYSVVKGFTDELMHLLESHVLNVRIRMPITADRNGRNFVTKITTYEKICSVPNSMTVLPELLPIMVDMAEKKRTGTVNLTNPGLITHNEILEMYREIVDPDFTWKNFTIEEQAEILAAGRSNNFLDTTRLESEYPNVKNIKDSVRDTLIKMKCEIQ